MHITSNIDSHITHYDFYEAKNPRINLVVVHGMAEHKERYKSFALKLNQQGIHVYVMDLRGHGNSNYHNHRGTFGAFENQLNDIQQIIQQTNNLPTYLMGHSMGSLFARSYLKRYNNMDGLIIMGSPYMPDGFNLIHTALKALAKLFPHKESKFFHKTMNQGFNKEIKNPRTPVDWLSFNEENVDNYIKDPQCNFPFTFSGYLTLFDLIEDVYIKDWTPQNSNLPLYFQAGEHDPCPDYKKDGFNKAISKLKDAGYSNITQSIYSNSRHELLQDNEKDQVIEDIIQFMYKNIEV